MLNTFRQDIFNVTEGKSPNEVKELMESEIQQCKLRVAVPIVLLLTIFLMYLNKQKESGDYLLEIYTLAFISISSIVYSFVPFYLIRKGRITQPHGLRLVIGQALDVLNLTLGWVIMSDHGPWVTMYYTVYCMIILGNGLRFGSNFLKTSAVFVLCGWISIFVFSTVWRENYWLWSALGLNFIVTAGYTLALVKRLSNVQSNLVAAEQKQVKTLQKVTQLKSKFFANISHEFRTPIAISMATLDSMVEESNQGKSVDIAKTLDPVVRSQKRLLNLVNQILDIEKMEQGEMSLKVQKVVKPSEYFSRRVQQFKNLAAKKGLFLKFDYQNVVDQADLFIDVDLVDKVIFNLISNAIKFTESGGVEFFVSLDSNNLLVHVKDTGVGIKQEYQAKVFNRFQQASGSVSKDYAGTGIGLALVKEVVGLHSGAVGVESEFGRGSTFMFNLPLGKEHFSADVLLDKPFVEEDQLALVDADGEQEGKENLIGTEETLRWNGEQLKHRSSKLLTILFVDDNQDLRNFILDKLRGRYEVFLGYDGQHGFEVAKQVKPDIIISDQMMPRVTGTQLLQKLKADDELKDVPFIILTAFANPEQKMEALKLGASDFLYKPFYTNEILVRVENLLTLSEQRRRIAKDLFAARAIQQSMLPSFAIDGDNFELTAFYKPCEELSGDFFDVLENDDYLVFYLADVTSHGVASAQVTYAVKNIFLNLKEKFDLKQEAAEMLMAFAEEFNQHQFDYGVALQIFRFDKKYMRLDMAHSSSPASFKFSQDNVHILSPKPGPFIHPRIHWKKEDLPGSEKVDLASGDLIFCCTDGVTEVQEGKTISPKRFADKIKVPVMRSSWQEQMLELLEEMSESKPFADDITMLRFKVK